MVSFCILLNNFCQWRGERYEFHVGLLESTELFFKILLNTVFMQIIQIFPRQGTTRATQIYWRNIKGSKSLQDDWILWQITINYLMMEKYHSSSGFSASQTWIVWNFCKKELASKGVKECNMISVEYWLNFCSNIIEQNSFKALCNGFQ